MRTIQLMLVAVTALSLTACANYVKRDEFDSTVAELRAADDGFRGADNDLRAQLDLMEQRFASLTTELQGQFDDFNAQIAQLQGRLRVDMTSHFAFGKAELTDDYKLALNEFSTVLRDYHPNVIVTVEGFTDSAGSAEYNKWLGQQRADSVRKYLIESGLDSSKVRAVSYGEDTNRQITPGAWGEKGSANRRVALVIDYIPS